MKATLKAALFTATLVLGAFSLITYTACNNDKCKGIVCAYNGVCNNGRCLCQSGYEGVQCETINRDRFLGAWQVKEDGTLSNEALYPITIVEGATVTDVLIRNVRNSILVDVKGSVKGDTLTIPLQEAGAFNVQGYGYLTDDNTYGTHGTMEVRYSVTEIATGVNDNFGLDSGKVSIWHK